MIILIVENVSITINKLESNTPIPVHGNRPNTISIALQRVQVKTGEIDIINLLCGINGSKLHAYFALMLCLNTGNASCFEVFFKVFALGYLDYKINVARCASTINTKPTSVSFAALIEKTCRLEIRNVPLGEVFDTDDAGA